MRAMNERKSSSEALYARYVLKSPSRRRKRNSIQIHHSVAASEMLVVRVNASEVKMRIIFQGMEKLIFKKYSNRQFKRGMK